ncbi:hypothetical protein Ppb6_02221 [Photorhabdus australis subsp. thailandensis]|uniref:Uncharacterized protein n=1 Tax=Photorhabdus australis subsp. thailandensis TaxID=2805096 RepID=A0A1C0U3M5_9GAMM|nr:hypothetical protein Ppb6_02221 [Photorhabdus australis subsp. thailandensis]
MEYPIFFSVLGLEDSANIAWNYGFVNGVGVSFITTISIGNLKFC